ncbi:hypothetical protein GCM10010343_14450 [Streptomyces avidinii]|uniref:Uncharacterized protein n=1 Tax=Streptomyces avidinii TaxID=1895 RepID=A0ABS4KY47_STRAV|nr:hypothetical protein [Streptomyces avidinii]GGY90110.1 hypothetical protein GCM10010343_14450 [Streptomyces avidinii]
MDSVPPENEQPPSAAESLPGAWCHGRLYELFHGAAPADEEAPAAVARACVDLMDVSGASVSLYGGPEIR